MFGENGALLLDVPDRLCRFLGSIKIGPDAGAFNIPVGDKRQAWCYILKINNGVWQFPEGVTLVGNTLRWEKQQDSRAFFIVIYGDC